MMASEFDMQRAKHGSSPIHVFQSARASGGGWKLRVSRAWKDQRFEQRWA